MNSSGRLPSADWSTPVARPEVTAQVVGALADQAREPGEGRRRDDEHGHVRGADDAQDRGEHDARDRDPDHDQRRATEHGEDPGRRLGGSSAIGPLSRSGAGRVKPRHHRAAAPWRPGLAADAPIGAHPEVTVKVKLILPALLEATDPGFRPIKYALFPPLGLAALAGYLSPTTRPILEDEHVMPLTLDDTPDLVVMSVYITSAKRAYEIADLYRRAGRHVALGGLHVTSLPDEAAAHADTVFIGPGEDTWPRVPRGPPARSAGAPLRLDRRGRSPRLPPLRRDLIDRRRYLCPNSLVVSRGCPHHCDFCYKDAFYAGGISFYTQAVDHALAEIERMPGRHVYFLDDHLLGNPRFATALFDGMRGMGRVFQGAEHRGRGPAARTCSSAPPRPGCAASSSASRRSTRPT